MRTAQELFDEIVTHLFKQGKPAGGMTGYDYTRCVPLFECRYRGSNGEKCAAGVVIADDVYDEGMEESDIEEVLENYHIPELEPHIPLLLDLQAEHDRSINWTDTNGSAFKPSVLATGLSMIAVKFGLSRAAIDRALAA